MTNTVLLVTLEGTHNFGNRLQHYALQHTIEKCGCNVVNLMVRTVPMYTKTQVKSAVKSIFVMWDQKIQNKHQPGQANNKVPCV